MLQWVCVHVCCLCLSPNEEDSFLRLIFHIWPAKYKPSPPPRPAHYQNKIICHKNLLDCTSTTSCKLNQLTQVEYSRTSWSFLCPCDALPLQKQSCKVKLLISLYVTTPQTLGAQSMDKLSPPDKPLSTSPQRGNPVLERLASGLNVGPVVHVTWRIQENASGIFWAVENT